MVAVPLDVHGDTADLSLFVPQPIVLVTFCFFSLATEIFWLCQKRVASFYDGVATCCFGWCWRLWLLWSLPWPWWVAVFICQLVTVVFAEQIEQNR